MINSLTKSDKLKLGKSTQAALDGLKQAGERGLTTMAGIALAGSRFPARVHDLRKLGYVIKVERVKGDRLEYSYKLIGFNVDPQLVLFKVA